MGRRMPNEALRTEHDAVLAALSTRESTRHFAHAAVGGFVALLLGGTARRLAEDSVQAPGLTLAVGLAGGLLLYSVARALVGGAAHRRERVQLARLRELRVVLGVDAPANVSARAS